LGTKVQKNPQISTKNTPQSISKYHKVLKIKLIKNGHKTTLSLEPQQDSPSCNRLTKEKACCNCYNTLFLKLLTLL
jgi:hypothetical protein